MVEASSYCLYFLLFIQLEVSKRKIQDMNKEQESLIDIFSEERARRDIEEENLRKKLKVIFLSIHFLLKFVTTDATVYAWLL